MSMIVTGEKLKETRGITLVALVITIVVMLILAGISINLVIGDNGIFKKAKEAEIVSEVNSIIEKIELEKISMEVELVSTTNFNGTLPAVNYENIIPEKWADSLIIASDGNLVYIGEDENSDLGKYVSTVGSVEKISNNNKDILSKIKTLSTLATNYKTENPSVTSSALELGLQFLRKDRYNSSSWTLAAGAVDTSFVSYVGSQVVFDQNAVWNDPITGENIDLVHSLATVNTYKHIGGSFVDVNDDVSGWVGDLTTLIGQVAQYSALNPSKTQSELNTYTNTLLAKNGVGSTFDLSDMLADIDAKNISKVMDDSSLYNTLLNYYYGVNRNICRYRFAKFNSEYEDLAVTANDLATAALILQGVNVSAEIKSNVIGCFVQYINNNKEF